MPDLIDQYFGKVVELLQKIKSTEKENIKNAADIIAEAIKQNKVLNVIGTGGHSQIGAEEVFMRAGGLVPVNAMLDLGWWIGAGAERAHNVERTPGYALAVLKQYDLKKGDVLLMTQPWGINAITIDTAQEAKRLGLTVIAITSPEFSKAVPADHPARHPSKKNLFELADVTINNYMPFEDAVLDVEGIPQKVCPVSTILTAFAEWCLVSQVVAKLVEMGVEPPVFRSANIPGGDEWNRRLIEKYRAKLKHL